MAETYIENEQTILKGKAKIYITIAVFISAFVYLYSTAIQGVATPSIIASLNGMEYYALTISSYMIFAAIGKILSGNLSDAIGRKNIFLFSLLLFGVGSLLVGFSQSIIQLILFKIIAGIGGGFLLTSYYSLIVEVYEEKMQLKILGYLSSIIGISFIVGPILGGFIIDILSWRWLYYLVLPLTIIAVYLANVALPTGEKTRKRLELDYTGALLLIITVVAALLTLSWGGTMFPWLSLQIKVLSALTIISFICLALSIKRSVNPILPIHVLNTRYFIVPTAVGLITAFVASIYTTYIPLFGQAVLGMSATVSGALMTPLMVVQIISSNVISLILLKKNKYKAMIIFLLTWAAVLIIIFSTFKITTNVGFIICIFALVGVSMGGFNVVFLAYLQKTMPYSHIGSAIGTFQFFQGIGGAISLAVSGIVMNYFWKGSALFSDKLKSELGSNAQNFDSTNGLTNTEETQTIMQLLPSDIRVELQQAILLLQDSLIQVFKVLYLTSAGLYGLGLLIVIVFLKSKKDRVANQIK